VKFSSFDPTGCHFPRPYVAVLPAFPSGMPGLCRSTIYRSTFLEQQCASYSLGRYALTEALRSLGVGPGKTVLIPAYHCRTMIDPVLRLGGKVMLFPLQQDLTPDWPELDACVSSCGKETVLLLPHYFGFPQPVKEVSAWCKRHQVAYVEDCSHAMFGEYDGKPIGSFGDRSFASPYKFFATEDGGVLRGVSPDTAAPLFKPGMGAELKAVWRSFEKFVQQRRRRLPMLESDGGFSCGTDAVKEEAGVSRHYDPAVEQMQALRWSRLSLRLSSIDRISVVRRQNYLAWIDAVSNMPGCRPLFQELPVGVVPYMFPLWLDHPEHAFFRLKRAGLPVFRWDDLAIGGCQISGLARLSLIHLPCHQGIGSAEMNWMVQVLRHSLTEHGAV